MRRTVAAPLWQLLYRARADIVLNGHSHNYQRWKPQDPGGNADPDRSVRQFIVGAAGQPDFTDAKAKTVSCV